MVRLHTPEQFKTHSARVWMGITGIILTYLLVTRALDTGSIWQYLGTIVLLVLSVRLVIRGVKNRISK